MLPFHFEKIHNIPYKVSLPSETASSLFICTTKDSVILLIYSTDMYLLYVHIEE